MNAQIGGKRLQERQQTLGGQSNAVMQFGKQNTINYTKESNNMKTESKEKWINWLNNADESQHITGECFDGRGYCAIGGFLVANGYQFGEMGPGHCTHPLVGYEDSPNIVPIQVMEAHDMTIEFMSSVVAQNDGHQRTFKQIAEFIQENA